MSLRGIDPPIMANRSTDLTPAISRTQREHDVNQNQIVQQDNKQVQRDQNRTLAVGRTEFNSISMQNQGGGGNNQTASDNKRKKNPDEDDESNAGFAPDGGHKIDIKV